MKRKLIKNLCVALLGFGLIWLLPSLAIVRGFYLTQPTFEKTDVLTSLIQRAKEAGLDTLVVDFEKMGKRYRDNVALVKNANLRYVARIVMFPGGADPQQAISQVYLQKRYNQIMQAVSLGADTIQLDYIRFKPTQKPSSNNSLVIYDIIKHVREMLKDKPVHLEVDIFGVAAHRHSKYIGQHAPLFAHSVDAICPMVYPSHYDPYLYYAKRPYQTVFDSVSALQCRLSDTPEVKVYAYIELFNYRYPLTHEQRINYILSELKAVDDSKANGWYAWSANNRYDILFEVLKLRAKGRTVPTPVEEKHVKSTACIRNPDDIIKIS